jgi:ribosomal protein S6E (S10)
MSQEVQRLLQAVEHFKARTRGAELPKGAQEAVDGLTKALGQPMPGRDTPGAREALSVAPGTTGTGVPMEQAAKGPDAPSPGQREAQGQGSTVSEEIAKAAAEIVANAQK